MITRCSLRLRRNFAVLIAGGGGSSSTEGRSFTSPRACACVPILEQMVGQSDIRAMSSLEPFSLQRLEVCGPSLVAVAAEFVEIIPAEKAGVVAIVEQDAHRVVADRLKPGDFDVPLAAHDLLLARRMSL